jgi:hypothetical protein
MTCTIGHPDVKADLTRLRTETVLIGVQRGAPGDSDYVLRNCLRCGSTLGIELETEVQLSGAITPHSG